MTTRRPLPLPSTLHFNSPVTWAHTDLPRTEQVQLRLHEPTRWGCMLLGAAVTEAPLAGAALRDAALVSSSAIPPYVDVRLYHTRADALVLVDRNGSGQTTATVAAATAERAAETLAQILADWPERAPSSETIPATFWYQTPNGPRQYLRELDALPWPGVRGNYPAAVADGMDELLARDAMPKSARFILWHGAPGTGKTSGLLSLAEAWQAWAELHYILDPERFFGDAGYMVSVCMENSEGPIHRGDAAPKRRARVLVIEEADEFITRDARDHAAQPFGRLLNLTDGLIGRGLRVLVLLTTNRRVDEFDPAVTRAGRCLADIEFRQHSPEEAKHWAALHGLTLPPTLRRNGATLAELFEALDPRKLAVERPRTPLGFTKPHALVAAGSV